MEYGRLESIRVLRVATDNKTQKLKLTKEKLHHEQPARN